MGITHMEPTNIVHMHAITGLRLGRQGRVIHVHGPSQPGTGRLELVGLQGLYGHGPRNLTLTPIGSMGMDLVT